MFPIEGIYTEYVPRSVETIAETTPIRVIAKARLNKRVNLDISCIESRVDIQLPIK